MIRRPPRSTQSRSSAASDVYKRQVVDVPQTGPDVCADAADAVAGARTAAITVTEVRTTTTRRARRYCLCPNRRKLIVVLPGSRLACRALRGNTGTRGGSRRTPPLHVNRVLVL